MLLESAYKIIAIILHISDSLSIVNDFDHEPQCGFCTGRGCIDGIFTIKMALKKRREHGLEMWILFFDLVKVNPVHVSGPMSMCQGLFPVLREGSSLSGVEHLAHIL